MNDRALPCIVCDKALYEAFEGASNQPLDGVEFTSPGHYGSAYWDPMDEHVRLAINVCDECLKAKRESTYVRTVEV